MKIKITEETYKKITEANKSPYPLHHNSYTSAVNAAEKYAEERGYELDGEEMGEKIGLGPKKPEKGETNRITLSLFKNGEKVKNKALYFQIYRMDNNKETYELNAYIA